VVTHEELTARERRKSLIFWLRQKKVEDKIIGGFLKPQGKTTKIINAC